MPHSVIMYIMDLCCLQSKYDVEEKCACLTPGFDDLHGIDLHDLFTLLKNYTTMVDIEVTQGALHILKRKLQNCNIIKKTCST